jgi:peroxisomal membrane protein 4
MASRPGGAEAAQGWARAVAVVLRALQQGGSFGARTRFPHALVVTALYRKGAVGKLAEGVARATWEHGRNLAYFAATYKAALVLLAWLGDGERLGEVLAAGARPRHWTHTALASALGAALVWSHPSAVNQQILYYLVARVLSALCVHLAQRGVQPFASIRFQDAYPAVAVAVWVAVMLLFEHDEATLAGSLRDAMRTIYHSDADLPAPDRDPHHYAPSPYLLIALLGALLAALARPSPAALLDLLRVSSG